MNKFILAGLIILVLIVAIGCAGTGKTVNTVSGTIFVSGNEPFTYLALKSDQDDYFRIECADSIKKELWSMQGKIVKLEYSDLKKSDRESIITVTKYFSE